MDRQGTGSVAVADFQRLFGWLLEEDSMSPENLFDMIDADGSGSLDLVESRFAIETLCNTTANSDGITAAEIDSALLEMDSDGSGEVTASEFAEWWERRQARVDSNISRFSRFKREEERKQRHKNRLNDTLEMELVRKQVMALEFSGTDSPQSPVGPRTNTEGAPQPFVNHEIPTRVTAANAAEDALLLDSEYAADLDWRPDFESGVHIADVPSNTKSRFRLFVPPPITESRSLPSLSSNWTVSDDGLHGGRGRQRLRRSMTKFQIEHAANVADATDAGASRPAGYYDSISLLALDPLHSERSQDALFSHMLGMHEEVGVETAPPTQLAIATDDRRAFWWRRIRSTQMLPHIGVAPHVRGQLRAGGWGHGGTPIESRRYRV
jgi:hypothetical protein